MKTLDKIVLCAAVALHTLSSSCNIVATGGTNYDLIDSQAARSAQVTPAHLDAYSRTQKPKTIINLRGENEGKSWYDIEKTYCENNDITLLNVRTRASRLPKKEEILTIIDAIKTAERPILLHCQGGSDRTGAATAIYNILEHGLPVKEAVRRGCTVYHGNLRSEQRDFFKMYEPFESTMPFETWVKDVYVMPVEK